jgi:L-iditol 2-dehydrogenase
VRVVRLHGVRDAQLTEEPVPATDPGMSLVRITAVGLCGSDLHWYEQAGIGDSQLDRPLVPGHEFAGIIAHGPRRGERVAVDPAIPCKSCQMCQLGYRNLCPRIRFAGHGDLDGAMQEYLAWPSSLLHPLPDTISDAEGAMLEPLGVALHALDLGRVRLGASVAVVGCGPIGLLLVQAARAAGAGTVIATDPLPHRRRAAGKSGADHAWEAATGSALAERVSATVGLGVDVAFEVAGTDPAVAAAMIAARPGARVVLVGIPDEDSTTFRASLARRKGLTIAMARRMNDTYPRAIDLVRHGTIDVSSLVTDRYPLAAAPDAFAAAVARRGLKTIVEVLRPEGIGRKGH